VCRGDVVDQVIACGGWSCIPRVRVVWDCVPGAAELACFGIQVASIAWIANRALNSVTRLNYFTGETTSVAAGVFPRAVVLVGSRVFVANSNLVGGSPAGPSWLTSFECCGVRTPDSIPLTGLAARFAVVWDDSLLYVVAAGRSGAADGKLSIVDPKRRTEVAVLNGLGESPGAVVFHPTGSRLLIASAREG